MSVSHCHTHRPKCNQVPAQGCSLTATAVPIRKGRRVTRPLQEPGKKSPSNNVCGSCLPAAHPLPRPALEELERTHHKDGHLVPQGHKVVRAIPATFCPVVWSVLGQERGGAAPRLTMASDWNAGPFIIPEAVKLCMNKHVFIAGDDHHIVSVCSLNLRYADICWEQGLGMWSSFSARKKQHPEGIPGPVLTGQPPLQESVRGHVCASPRRRGPVSAWCGLIT